jgi:hypothetical protein
MTRAWCFWIARRLWWGTIVIGIAAGVAVREGQVRGIAWGLFLLAAALSIIDQVLFLVEEGEWVRDQVSSLGVKMLVLRILSMGLLYYFVLRGGTLVSVTLLTHWIAGMFR